MKAFFGVFRSFWRVFICFLVFFGVFGHFQKPSWFLEPDPGPKFSSWFLEGPELVFGKGVLPVGFWSWFLVRKITSAELVFGRSLTKNQLGGEP